MKKKIHLNTSIFIKNPHVYKIEANESVIMKAKSYCYRHLAETWGYTKTQFPSKSYFNKIILQGNSVTFENYNHFYIFFSSEESVLQFKLANDLNMKKVKMWPSSGFTIHEYLY